ncbi:MAG: DMT family transporter [Candidatus Levybacteria bacterium]|nr:DMT family transporter [Candidatus Levybacteria bacterium]MBP9815382.1 DMT family transporter [Candidatus Levybacteria bacterium]
MKLSTTKKAVIALIIANTIWGAAPPIFKWALYDIGPFSLAFYRFLLATLITLPFVYKNLSFNPKYLLSIIIIGITGVTINISFFFFGLELAPSINASIVGSAGPIILIFSSIFFLHEKFKKKLFYGALVGLLGVLLIILKPLFTNEPNIAILGSTLIFIGMLGSIAHTLLAKKIIKKLSPMTITFWTFFFGTVGFIPFFYEEGLVQGFIPQMSGNVIFGILFGAVLSSFVAYFLSFWALKYLQAEDVGIFVYIDPVVTVLIAGPLLGEYPDLLFILGSLFVFGGIFIAEKRIHWHPLHRLTGRQ